MSKRAWDGYEAPWLIIIVGIALFAIVASTAFYSKGQHNADQRHQAENKAREAARDAYRECRRMTSVQEALECHDSASKTSRDAQIAEHDLDAQWEMANWAELIFWATVFIGCGTLITTALGVYWVKKTLTATSNAVEAAIDSNKLIAKEQRPWIGITVWFTDGTLSGEQQGEITVFYKLENFGKSPASFAIHATNNGFGAFDREFKRHKEAIQVDLNPDNFGYEYTIFPGKFREYKRKLKIARDSSGWLPPNALGIRQIIGGTFSVFVQYIDSTNVDGPSYTSGVIQDWGGTYGKSGFPVKIELRGDGEPTAIEYT